MHKEPAIAIAQNVTGLPADVVETEHLYWMESSGHHPSGVYCPSFRKWMRIVLDSNGMEKA